MIKVLEFNTSFVIAYEGRTRFTNIGFLTSRSGIQIITFNCIFITYEVLQYFTY